MLDDYLLPTNQFDCARLLSDWRWLIGDKPIAIEAIAGIGNLFLRGESGRIYLLDIEDGTCECIAESTEQLEKKLSDRHNRRAWLQGFLIRELRQKGVLLEPDFRNGSSPRSRGSRKYSPSHTKTPKMRGE